MTRSKQTFRESDLKRAVRVAIECNLPIQRTEITKDGKITLIHQGPHEQTPLNEFDAWMSGRAN